MVEPHLGVVDDRSCEPVGTELTLDLVEPHEATAVDEDLDALREDERRRDLAVPSELEDDRGCSERRRTGHRRVERLDQQHEDGGALLGSSRA